MFITQKVITEWIDNKMNVQKLNALMGINGLFKKLAHCQWGSQPDSHLPNWQKCSISSSQVAQKTFSMTSLSWWCHPWRHWLFDVIYDIIGNALSNSNPDLAIKITIFGCHGNQCPMPDSAPIPDLRAKFGANRSVNGGGDSGQTNIQTFLVL